MIPRNNKRYYFRLILLLFILRGRDILTSGIFFGKVNTRNSTPIDVSSSRTSKDKRKIDSKNNAVTSDPYLPEDEIERFLVKYDKKEKQMSESYQRYEGKSIRMEDFKHMLPKINFHFDPVVNFKLKQKITKLGASITLGMDYLSDLRQWRARCDVEDTIVRGRFSLRGSELGWAKSWLWNLGLGESSSAKFKLRVGLNLKNYKAYVRLRFRTESVSPFDIGDGLTCAGKVGIPGLLHVLGSKPLRLEYLLRVRTPAPEFSIKRNDRDGLVSISTGIDKVDISLDELNFCLEWDEDSPLWDIGLVRDMNRSLRRPLNSIRRASNRATGRTSRASSSTAMPSARVPPPSSTNQRIMREDPPPITQSVTPPPPPPLVQPSSPPPPQPIAKASPRTNSDNGRNRNNSSERSRSRDTATSSYPSAYNNIGPPYS